MEIQEVQVVDKVYRFKGKYLSKYHAVNGLKETFTYRLYKTLRGYRVNISGSENRLTGNMPEWWARWRFPVSFEKARLLKKIDLD